MNAHRRLPWPLAILAVIYVIHGKPAFAGMLELDLQAGADLSRASGGLVDHMDRARQAWTDIGSVESARATSGPEFLPVLGLRLEMPIPGSGGRTRFLGLGSDTWTMTVGLQYGIRRREVASNLLVRDPVYMLDRELIQTDLVEVEQLAIPVSVGHRLGESVRLYTGATLVLPLSSGSTSESSVEDRVYANGERKTVLEIPRLSESVPIEDLLRPVSFGWDLGVSWQPGYTLVLDAALAYRTNPINSDHLDLGGWSARVLLGYHFIL
jgi:hypothetical protein